MAINPWSNSILSDAHILDLLLIQVFAGEILLSTDKVNLKTSLLLEGLPSSSHRHFTVTSDQNFINDTVFVIYG